MLKSDMAFLSFFKRNLLTINVIAIRIKPVAIDQQHKKTRRAAYLPTSHEVIMSAHNQLVNDDLPKSGDHDWSRKNWDRALRIRVELMKRRMNQADLAERLGITREYTGRIIWGVQRPRHYEERIAELFGVSWHELFAPGAAA